MAGSLNKRSLRVFFTAKRAIDDVDETDRGFIRALQFQVTRDGSPFGRKCFPTIVTAARTRDRRATPDHHVAKLTRRSALAAINLTVKNDPRANTFRD